MSDDDVKLNNRKALAQVLLRYDITMVGEDTATERERALVRAACDSLLDLGDVQEWAELRQTYPRLYASADALECSELIRDTVSNLVELLRHTVRRGRIPMIAMMSLLDVAVDRKMWPTVTATSTALQAGPDAPSWRTAERHVRTLVQSLLDVARTEPPVRESAMAMGENADGPTVTVVDHRGAVTFTAAESATELASYLNAAHVAHTFIGDPPAPNDVGLGDCGDPKCEPCSLAYGRKVQL